MFKLKMSQLCKLNRSLCLFVMKYTTINKKIKKNPKPKDTKQEPPPQLTKQKDPTKYKTHPKKVAQT